MTAKDMPLPEPARWVSEEPRRHGMHRAYRSAEARNKYGGEGMWHGYFSPKQMHAFAEEYAAARCAELLKACVPALWALAHASENSSLYKADYEKFSAAIAASRTEVKP